MPIVRVNEELWEMVNEAGRHGESKGDVILRLIRDKEDRYPVELWGKDLWQGLKDKISGYGDTSIPASKILKIMEEMEGE